MLLSNWKHLICTLIIRYLCAADSKVPSKYPRKEKSPSLQIKAFTAGSGQKQVKLHFRIKKDKFSLTDERLLFVYQDAHLEGLQGNESDIRQSDKKIMIYLDYLLTSIVIYCSYIEIHVK